jgi:hypothetical protein
MKRIFLLISVIFILVSCIPKLVQQDGKNYKIIDWNGGNFVNITYIWKGGKFDDAIELIRKINEITKTRGLDETAIGIFPPGKEWQLGFISKGPINFEFIMGNKVSETPVPEGKYASMKIKGFPEYLFLYYEKLRKWISIDGYKVESQPIEIYNPDSFNAKMQSVKRNGELRFRISQ